MQQITKNKHFVLQCASKVLNVTVKQQTITQRNKHCKQQIAEHKYVDNANCFMQNNALRCRVFADYNVYTNKIKMQLRSAQEAQKVADYINSVSKSTKTTASVDFYWNAVIVHFAVKQSVSKQRSKAAKAKRLAS